MFGCVWLGPVGSDPQAEALRYDPHLEWKLPTWVAIQLVRDVAVGFNAKSGSLERGAVIQILVLPHKDASQIPETSDEGSLFECT